MALSCTIASGQGRLAALALLTLGSGSGCTQIAWRTNLGRSLDQAGRDGRMVVVWYWRPMNRDCDQMERTVFRSPEVAKQMEGAIPVRLHADFSRRFAAEQGLTEVPSFVAIGPDGRTLRRRGGVMDTDQFLAFLQVARLSP